MEGKINIEFPDQAIIDLIKIPIGHTVTVKRKEFKVITGRFETGITEVMFDCIIVVKPPVITVSSNG